jgi:hypothetical protein
VKHASSLRALIATASVAVGLGCASDDNKTSSDVVLFNFEGALTGMREIETDGATSHELLAAPNAFGGDTWGGPRIGCTVVNDSETDPSKGQVMVVSAVQNYGEEHGTGVYLRMPQFHGVGTYNLEQIEGRAWTFDNAHIQSCVREDDVDCFQGNTGCQVNVDQWSFTPATNADRPSGYPPEVTFGVAKGTFSCARLVNRTGLTVSLVRGVFSCRAQDWTQSPQQ